MEKSQNETKRIQSRKELRESNRENENDGGVNDS